MAELLECTTVAEAESALKRLAFVRDEDLHKLALILSAHDVDVDTRELATRLGIAVVGDLAR